MAPSNIITSTVSPTATLPWAWCSTMRPLACTIELSTPEPWLPVVRATSVRVEAEGGPATLSMYLDDTERKAAEDAVRRSEALLSHLVATSPDVITLTELQSGRYAMVNDTFCRLSGYRAEEVIGRTSLELDVWSHLEEREQLVRELRERGSAQNLPAAFNTKDGRRISLLVSAARFAMDGRDYLVINARDVTETPIGFLPTPAALDTAALDLRPDRLQEALRVDAGEWLNALSDLDDFYGQFGDRLPQAIAQQLTETRRGFGA